MRLPRWLGILMVITVAGVLLPITGMLVPSLEWLRGFAYSWLLLLFAWMLVGLYLALKFISSG